jgi:hypothetical protein
MLGCCEVQDAWRAKRGARVAPRITPRRVIAPLSLGSGVLTTDKASGKSVTKSALNKIHFCLGV